MFKVLVCLSTGERDREHPEELGHRADDRGRLRHLARRQPDLCPARNPGSDHGAR